MLLGFPSADGDDPNGCNGCKGLLSARSEKRSCDATVTPSPTPGGVRRGCRWGGVRGPSICRGGTERGLQDGEAPKEGRGGVGAVKGRVAVVVGRVVPAAEAEGARVRALAPPGCSCPAARGGRSPSRALSGSTRAGGDSDDTDAEALEDCARTRRTRGARPSPQVRPLRRSSVGVEVEQRVAYRVSQRRSTRRGTNSNQNGILKPKGSTRAEFAPFSHEPGLE